MENLFEQILDKDEKIIKVFKPNKAKLYVSSLLGVFTFLLFSFIPMIIGFIVSEESAGKIALFVALACMVIIICVTILLTELYYRKRVYAYSNKRIIIRTGIIGVDFKSLDMAMIGAVNVYVSVIDKILRKNTGTISFGSTASPIVNYGNNGANPYKFSGAINPYELYKEVKSVIDDYKEKKAK